jgi:hypothetical protein
MTDFCYKEETNMFIYQFIMYGFNEDDYALLALSNAWLFHYKVLKEMNN